MIQKNLIFWYLSLNIIDKIQKSVKKIWWGIPAINSMREREREKERGRERDR